MRYVYFRGAPASHLAKKVIATGPGQLVVGQRRVADVGREKYFLLHPCRAISIRHT